MPPSEPHTSFEPPRTSPQLVWPRNLEDCENGGWRNYVQFENERQCKDSVREWRRNATKPNRPSRGRSP